MSRVDAFQVDWHGCRDTGIKQEQSSKKGFYYFHRHHNFDACLKVEATKVAKILMHTSENGGDQTPFIHKDKNRKYESTMNLLSSELKPEEQEQFCAHDADRAAIDVVHDDIAVHSHCQNNAKQTDRPSRFGVTPRCEKRRRRAQAKKTQRADRKIMAKRQENLTIAIKQLSDWIRVQQLAPTADSRSGVEKAMHEIGKWVRKLDPSMLHSDRLSTKSRVSLSLVSGHQAARDYHRGRIDVYLILHQLDALELASEEVRQLYNPGKKQKPRKRRRGQPVVAKALNLDVGGKRTADETLSDILRYVSRYCKRPPSSEQKHLEDQLGRLLGCRTVTKKRLANGTLQVGNSEEHQSLSGMMVDVVYAAVYEFLDKHADVALTNEDFFASRRRYHLSRAHRTGEEHHQR